MSDVEQCSNQIQLDLISILVNLSYELGQIMTRYDLLGLDTWFWAMFKSTPTWPNLTFGQLYMCIGANNDKMIYLKAWWVNFSNVRINSNLTKFHFWPTCYVNLGNNDQIWLSRHEARQMILINIWSNSNFT